MLMHDADLQAVWPQVLVSLPERDFGSYEVDSHSDGVCQHDPGWGPHERDAVVAAVDNNRPPSPCLILEPEHEHERRRICLDSMSDSHQSPMSQRLRNLTVTVQGPHQDLRRPYQDCQFTATCPRMQPTPAPRSVVNHSPLEYQLVDVTPHDGQPVSTDIELDSIPSILETSVPDGPSAMLNDGSILQALAKPTPACSIMPAHPLGAHSIDEVEGTAPDLETTTHLDVSDTVEVEIDFLAELDEEEVMPHYYGAGCDFFTSSSIGHVPCPELGLMKGGSKSDFSAIIQVPPYFRWIVQL